MLYKDIIDSDIPKKYEIKEFVEKDIPSYNDLFNRVYNRKYEEDFWKYFFFRNPYESISLTIWDKDKMIGAYSSAKKKFSINRVLNECSIGSNAMVDSEYRGQGLFIYLAKSLYNKLSEKGFTFFYGYPNEKYSCGLYNKKLSWDFCEKKSILIKAIHNTDISITNSNLSIEKIERFPESLDDFTRKEKDGIFTVRTSEYLNWRYTDHYLNDYDLYIIYNKEDSITGYFVLKTYINDKKESFGELDDFEIFNDNLEVFDYIYQFALRSFIDKKNDYMSIWVGNNTKYFKFLIDNQFIQSKMATSWGFKLLQDLKIEVRNAIMDPLNWDLKMGDCDVF